MLDAIERLRRDAARPAAAARVAGELTWERAFTAELRDLEALVAVSQALAVASTTWTPRTLRRCAGIRDWLERRGVDRATLLVIPEPARRGLAPDGRAGRLAPRAGGEGRRASRSTVAPTVQRPPRAVRGAWSRGRRAGAPPSSSVSTAYATQRAVRRGPRDPARGRAAPCAASWRPPTPTRPRCGASCAAASTGGPARRRHLRDAARCARPRFASAPPRRSSARSRLRRQAAARVRSPLWRLDVHPADLDHRRHLHTIEALIDRARTRAPRHLRRSPRLLIPRARLRCARRRAGDLDKNWREGHYRDGTPYAFSCPSPPRYRHQWYWDSCFHAIVWRHFDPARARQELRTLLRAGRPDGLVPHTVFWDRPARWRRAPLYGTHRCSATRPPPRCRRR